MTTPPAQPAALTVEELRPRLGHADVIDVRTPAEYGSGHIPGALNVPLDRLDDALPALRTASSRAPLVAVCASGGRSGAACARLAAAGVPAASLDGGTDAWASGGHRLDRPSDGGRAVWPMERQVRLTAGSLVVLGVLLDLAIPGARVLSLLIGAGLVFSALSNTCGMAVLLSKLPHNRRAGGGTGWDATLRILTDGRTGGAAGA